VLFAACSEDRLNIPQKGVINLDEFYITDADAESALVAVYAHFAQNIASSAGANIYVPLNILLNYPADNVLAAGNFYGDNDMVGAMDEFRFDSQSPVVSLAYSHFYWVIYRCNLITDNFTYGVSPVKDRCIAEAKVIRAWCYMMLAMAWGNPPLVDHVLKADEKPANFEGGHDALLQWCADECAEAVPYLDERQSTADKDGAVRVTKGFAWTVQGKALMYLGEYETAKTPLRNIINSGKYALVPGTEWASLFHIEGDGSSEKIFESNIMQNASIGTWSGKIQRSTWMEANIWGWRSDKLAAKPVYQAVGGWGGLAIQEDFAEEFIAHDGDSYRRKGTMLSFNEFLTEIEWPSDKGKPDSATVAQKMADPKRGITDLGGLYGQSLYLQKKHIATKADILQTNSYRFNNFIIERYANVLLLYAEACANTTDGDGAGLAALREVQLRAGIPSANVSTTLTLDAVKKERNFELWCERERWIDMKRWGEFDNVVNAGENIPSLKDAFFTLDEAAHRGYLTYSEPNKDANLEHGFKANKNEWFPYPYAVTSINPNLVQNPGY